MNLEQKKIEEYQQNSCWSLIGVYGDDSCSELETNIHCRNCFVYITAGRKLFEREPSEIYLENWNKIISKSKEEETKNIFSVMVFRLGNEWFGINTKCLAEITELKPVHSIPLRNDKYLKGIVNIRGEIQICVSLHNFLEIDNNELNNDQENKNKVYKRMLVIQKDNTKWVFQADEIMGMIKFNEKDIHKLPVTIDKSFVHYLKSLIRLENKDIGFIDEELLFNNLRRGI